MIFYCLDIADKSVVDQRNLKHTMYSIIFCILLECIVCPIGQGRLLLRRKLVTNMLFDKEHVSE